MIVGVVTMWLEKYPSSVIFPLRYKIASFPLERGEGYNEVEIPARSAGIFYYFLPYLFLR